MLSRDIPLFKLDLTGKNPDNFISAEYYRREDLESDIVFVMRAGPFYTSSLVLTTVDGNTLVENDDYEIYGIASALTAFAKDKEVGMMIKMLNSTVSEWFASYQVMGHFSILNQDLVHLIDSAINDDRPLYYRNIKKKPLWFDPTLHQHDLRYEIHSFSDLIDIIQRIPEIKKHRKDATLFGVEQFYDTITSHIDAYETMLLDIIKKHDSDNASPLTNSHGLKASQVGLGNVDNYATATLLDALDGFRQDLHLTADNVKQVMEQQQDANKTLYPFGIIPLLRYGDNSFIPPPIQGSYEGMGGVDFKVGFNVEPSGDVLVLGNRNDGRVNSLYFMRNKKPATGTGLLSGEWEYTAFAYSHQTALNEGVNLNKIIRGSDGRFLIIGGEDKSGTTVWYYALGNGSFNPLKHVLIRVPDNVNVQTPSLLFNEGFPDRILLFTRQAGGASIISGEYRNIAYDTPTNANSFDGVDLTNSTIGYWGYEYNIADAKWRRIMFNYTQCGRNELITARIWIPYKTVIEPTSVERPRADGANHAYGIGANQYYFASLIRSWNNRGWFECALGFYKKSNDSFYIKMLNASYGQDDRTGTHEGGTWSFNIVVSNRVVGEDDLVSYTIENRRGVDQLYRYDPTVFNSSGKTNTDENVTDSEGNKVKAPFGESSAIGYAGDLTLALINGTYYIGLGSTGYGTFPIRIASFNLTGGSNVADPDVWVDNRINFESGIYNANKFDVTYNETNPAGFSIGMNSVFWQQLDPNDPKSMGSISFGNNGTYSGMVYRRQPAALNSRGYPQPPSKDLLLYTNKQVKGYELDNTSYYIFDNDYASSFIPWCTNVFIDSPDNRKSDYVKHFSGHQSISPTAGEVNNATARTRFHIEWEAQQTTGTIKINGENKTFPGYTFVPTKTIEMRSIINDVLIPKIIEGAKTLEPNESFTFVNALALHRISFTHLRSNKYENLLIFATIGFHETRMLAKTYAVAFNLTGGTPDEDGIIQGAKATIVGEVRNTSYTSPLSGEMDKARKEGAVFPVGKGSSQVQPRDVIRQLENGKSLINIQWNFYVNVTANLSKPGASYIVSENGIETAIFKYAYWTPSGYSFFHHPYYGMVARILNAGPAQVGTPLTYNPDTAEESLKNQTGLVMGDSNYMEGNFTVIFATSKEGLQNGNKYTLGTGQRDLNEVVSDPRNKTFYIYLDYNENGAYYNISLTPQAETASRGLLSIVKTNNDSIYEIVNYNVFTMNGIRISIEKKGSVIPAASGSIYESGQLEGWVTNNRS